MVTSRTNSKKHSAEQTREIAKRLYVLAKALNEKLDSERIDIYLQALSDLPFKGLCLALEGMVTSFRWFPKIPEIREAVMGSPGDHDWDLIAAMVHGWRDRMEFENDILYSGFSSETASSVVKFDLSGLNAVSKRVLMRMGGPRALASANPSNLPLIKKDFLSEYRHVAEEHPHLLEPGNEVTRLLESVPLKGFKQ